MSYTRSSTDELLLQVARLKQELTDLKRQKLDLEILLENTTEHSDTVEFVSYQQAEAALKASQEAQVQLLQAEKMSSLGRLVAGVAHEINNPVACISGNLMQLEVYLQDLVNHLKLYQTHYPVPVNSIQDHAEHIELDYVLEDMIDIFASMQVGADRLRQLISSLRIFSRSDLTSKMLFNLHDGLDSTLTILRHSLKQKESRPAIHVVKNYGELPLVSCYPGQINQVFMNILANAIDALDEAHLHADSSSFDPNISISTSVTIDKSKHRWAIVRISDNGLGMTEQVRTQLFEPMFTTKGIGKGTGLGLSISHQIVVEKHGGRLSCHSKMGGGAEFVIELPILEPQD